MSQINLLINQPSWQTVSQDSFLITLLVNKWSASLSNRQSLQFPHQSACQVAVIGQLSNHSAGQQVISQLVKQSVIRQLSNHTAGQQVIRQLVKQSVKTVTSSISWSTSDQITCYAVSSDSYLVTQLVNKWSASLPYSRSWEWSNHSTGRQVGSESVSQ